MRKTIAIVALAVCALVALSAVSGAGATGAKERRTGCGGMRLGSTYINGITAKRTSCDKAKAVAKGFTKCRRHHGGANGHCNGRVKHFKCSENRYDKSTFQYSSNVVCKHRAQKVKFSYTQNL